MEKGCYPLSRFATFAHDGIRFNESWRIIIVAPNETADSRHDDLLAWLAQFDGLADAGLQPASVDASFRSYFRVNRDSESFIVMDAPPPHEDCHPYVQIAGYLESMGLNCPRILGADFENGFILMTDLGSTRYIDELERDSGRATELYNDAIDALLTLQEKGEAYQQQLPTYDYDFISFELSIFRDWLCGRHLGIDFSDEEEKQWQDCCEFLIDNALRQKQVFMHRDYHSRNLMLTPENNPGILDFQDAVEGPITYDVVSLFKDCYIKWPADQVKTWALQYYKRLNAKIKKELSEDEFLQQFDLMGVQRHLKAAGIFARLNHRDEKPGYLGDIPRTLEYISDTAPQFAELTFLADLVSNRVAPSMTEEE
jgi:aminoglycoside/choline kinase family phosphotransferase